MKYLVIDSSIVVKWFIPEKFSEFASVVLKSTDELVAPDFIYSEVSNILWRKVYNQEIPAQTAEEIIAELLMFPITTYDSKQLMQASFEMAEVLNRNVYESVYIVLANKLRGQYVTADKKLYKELQATSFRFNIKWVEDLPRIH